VSEPQENRPTLLDRWWVRLLVAAWVLAIVTIYFWRQIGRVLELAGVTP
jgi:hypothetical protein